MRAQGLRVGAPYRGTFKGLDRRYAGFRDEGLGFRH